MTTHLIILTSNLFVPHIIYPTRITTTSKTLIDNIFSNSLNFSQGTSGKLTISISDHLAQFLIIPEESYKLAKRNNMFKRDTANFDRENFILDLLNVDWPSIISGNKKDPNYSINSFEDTINSLLDKYLPLKNLPKRNLNNNLNHG